MMPILAILSALVFAITATFSYPITSPHTLIVYSPPITSPTKSMNWYAGSTHNVTWSTANMPPQQQDATGLILLGHRGNNSENLNTAEPLASRFLIRQGWVEVTMPKTLEARSDYFVVLFGDSGNTSPDFTIAKAHPA